MKKLLIAVIVLTLLSCVGWSSAEYEETPLDDMSIESLFELEDDVVRALRVVFYNESTKSSTGEVVGTYVINPKSNKFHFPFCDSALKIGLDRQFIYSSPSELIAGVYEPCGSCKPGKLEE